jgi:hypothetical protein
MRRVACMSVAVLGAIALVAGVATAHEAKYETKKVTIRHPDPQTFKGKVRAGGGCKPDRTVKVTKLDEYGGKSDPVGTSQTDESGRWTMSLPSAATAGSYKAVAKKDTAEGEDGVLHKCKKGTSRVISF